MIFIKKTYHTSFIDVLAIPKLMFRCKPRISIFFLTSLMYYGYVNEQNS